MVPAVSYVLAVAFVSLLLCPAALAKDALLTDRPIRDKWAVVIGIDHFKDKRIPSLEYAAKDAKDFAEFLVTSGNFARDHVVILLNEDATENNIQRVIGDDWLPRRVLPDDVVVIFASSHGSPKTLDVAGQNFLIAYDSNRDSLFSTAIELEDLANTIRKRTSCDRVVVFLDACNSGAANAGGKSLVRLSNFDLNNIAGEGQIVVSSSKAEQLSWESKRYKNGVFTRNLIKALQSQGQATKLKDAFDKLKDSVEQEVRFDRRVNQTPQMKMRWNGAELALLSKPLRPRATPPYVLTKEKVLQPASSQSNKPVEEKRIDRQDSERASTARLAVITFFGPARSNVAPGQNVLWGGISNPQQLLALGPSFNQALASELEKRKELKGKMILPQQFDKTLRLKFEQFAQVSKFDTRKWQASDWRILGKRTGVSYVLTGTIDEANWRTTTWSNRYTFIVSAKIIDTKSGIAVATVDRQVTMKAPWTSDMGGGVQFFEKKVIPTSAKNLVKSLMSQMKSVWRSN